MRSEIEELNGFIDENINKRVYRAGFATSQFAYEQAVKKLFAALDQMENRLSTQRYIVGNRIVESDWRFVVPLIRFDAVYHEHLKCSIRRIVDYPHLFGYLKDLYQQEGISDIVNFDHIKRHYYITHDDINPTGIVPLGPYQDLLYAHERENYRKASIIVFIND